MPVAQTLTVNVPAAVMLRYKHGTRHTRFLQAPAPMVAPLARVVGLLERARDGLTCPRSGFETGLLPPDGRCGRARVQDEGTRVSSTDGR